MQRWIAALLSVLIGGPLLLAAACGGGGATTVAPGTSTPPGWNEHASSEGLTLTVDPPSGQVWSGVRIRGSVSTELTHVGDKVGVQFWPDGAFRKLGKDEESNYKGDIWSSTETLVAYLGPDGTFETDPMKIPRAIRVGGELRLTEPGHHWFALVLDDKHAVFAPFEVTPEQPLPTVSPAPYLSLGSFQFLDAKTGWLSASSCRDEPRATPDEYGNQPTQAPPVCKAGFYGTTDGGQTWSLLAQDEVGPFVMDSSGAGIAVGSFCEPRPCKSRILHTTDGGRHWAETVSPMPGLTAPTLIDGEAWLVGDSCGYNDGGLCERYLLKSTDGGSTWSQSALPITGYGISLSRPTKHDAWIASSWSGSDRPAKIIVTHDGGQTWNPLPHPTGHAFATETFFRSAQQGWLLIGGMPGNSMFQDKWLYGTTDGGATWTQLFGRPGDISGNLGPLVFTSDKEGWLATAHGGLSRTTDGGLHWSHVDFDGGQTDPNPVVQFVDGQHGWTTSDDYSSFTGPRKILWSTSDGGATWQKLPLPAPESP